MALRVDQKISGDMVIDLTDEHALNALFSGIELI